MISDLSPFEMTSLGKRESRMLQRYLGDLSLSVGAKDAFIADLSGHFWLSSADGHEYDQETFTVVLATGMGAAVEMMSVLDDSRGTSIFLHEGERFVFSAAHIEQEMVLALIFEQGTAHHHIENVYSCMKQAVEGLRKVIVRKEPPAESANGRHEDIAFPEADPPVAASIPSEIELSEAASIGIVQGPALLSYQEAAELGLLAAEKEPPAETPSARHGASTSPEATPSLAAPIPAEFGLSEASGVCAGQTPALLSYQEAANLGLLNLDLASH